MSRYTSPASEAARIKAWPAVMRAAAAERIRVVEAAKITATIAQIVADATPARRRKRGRPARIFDDASD